MEDPYVVGSGHPDDGVSVELDDEGHTVDSDEPDWVEMAHDMTEEITDKLEVLANDDIPDTPQDVE